MARIKFKQILSNVTYQESANILSVQGTTNPGLIVSGAVAIVDSPSITGSITIKDINSFGDSGSFYTVDLGDYWYLWRDYIVFLSVHTNQIQTDV